MDDHQPSARRSQSIFKPDAFHLQHRYLTGQVRLGLDCVWVIQLRNQFCHMYGQG